MSIKPVPLTVLIKEAVAREIAKLPKPSNGKDGRDGRDGRDGKDGVTTILTKQEVVRVLDDDALIELREKLDREKEAIEALSSELEKVKSFANRLSASIVSKGLNITGGGKDWEVVFTNKDTEVRDRQIVVCENDSQITVTLHRSAKRGAQVNIKRTNAPVLVKGKIDDVDDKLINTQYYSMKLVFDGEQWREI